MRYNYGAPWTKLIGSGPVANLEIKIPITYLNNESVPNVASNTVVITNIEIYLFYEYSIHGILL